MEGGGAWSAQDTTPAAVAEALRELLRDRLEEGEAYVPARVLNLVAVVDRDWRGEIDNRLERVGRYHPSRTIVCAVEPGRRTIDARVSMTVAGDPRPGERAIARERVALDLGPRHLEALDTVVDPLVVSDIATVAWSPHGHPEALDALARIAQVVLIDSVAEPEPAAALARARNLAGSSYVVDLAWLRSTPWRERVAASFDPPAWRDELGRISAVTVRTGEESTVAGALFLGWLSSRLGWEPGPLAPAGDGLAGSARGRQEVELALERTAQDVPGLAGISVETASGMSLSLDRGPGGLSARRCDRDGSDSAWTVLGASRGESGILGEGIRQALLRDPTYRPALACAEAMLR